MKALGPELAVEEAGGITRRRVDFGGTVGFVTVKGNMGTLYFRDAWPALYSPLEPEQNDLSEQEAMALEIEEDEAISRKLGITSEDLEEDLSPEDELQDHAMEPDELQT